MFGVSVRTDCAAWPLQLVDIGATHVNEVAAGFDVNTESVRRWRKSLDGDGLKGWHL